MAINQNSSQLHVYVVLTEKCVSSLVSSLSLFYKYLALWFTCSQRVLNYWLANLLILSVPCEGYYRNESFRLTAVIKFVSDLRQVGGFLRVLRFPPPIKLTATI